MCLSGLAVFVGCACDWIISLDVPDPIGSLAADSSAMLLLLRITSSSAFDIGEFTFSASLASCLTLPASQGFEITLGVSSRESSISIQYNAHDAVQ